MRITKIIFFLIIASPLYSKPLHVQVDAQVNKKTKLALVAIGQRNASFETICKVIKSDLQFTHQFDVDVFFQVKMLSKKDVVAFNKQGYPIALIVNQKPEEKLFEARVYNTRKSKMIKGYKVPQIGTIQRSWGHALADAVLPVLTGNDGFFSSKIAYYKESKTKKNICIADFDGKYERSLIEVKSAAVAPCWNKDPINPLILYSEYTPLNVRLMTANMQGKKSVAVNFDGLNMLPAFSEDGQEVVMCLSCDGSSQLYHYGYNKRTKKTGYTRLTHNNGNNISPSLMNNGDVVFCSDYEKGRPHIYHLKRRRGTVTRLSDGGSCFSPSYSLAAHKIAYSQMHKGTAQIIIYDLEKGTEKQLTFDNGHKLECSWSPCGNYLAFSFKEGKTQRIAIQSLLTHKRRFLTSVQNRCSYPSWSINYSRFSLQA